MEQPSLSAPTTGLPSDMVQRVVAASRRPKNLGAVPDGAVSLALGEPFSDTPAEVTEAAIAALRAGRTRYAPLTGAPDLRAALAHHLSDESGARIGPEQVVLTHGASAGLAALFLATVNVGDTVVIPEPTYSLYADHVAMAGGQVAWVANTASGDLDVDAIAARLPGSRALVLCNPSNPTGRVIPEATLTALAGLAAEHGVLLICDEAYADIVFDGIAFASSLRLEGPEVICVGTFSKSYAMTGWRLGYVVATAAIGDRINLIHRTINGSLNTAVQDAALVALRLPASHRTDLAAEYQRRRDLVVARLSEAPFLQMATPQGAFYAFPRLETHRPSEEITQDLASQGGVLVRAGVEYGPSGEGHIRLCFATDMATLEEGLHRMLNALPDLL